MKLYEWISVRELEQLIQEGLVSDRKHPTLPLHILNYTHAAASVKNWTPTLSRCRGLVYEEGTMDLYAIPLPKFWNYNDAAHPETLPENLPKTLPTLYEKVDGSLGIAFFYKCELIIATRGSFESDQAKWAQTWMEPKVDNILISSFERKFTYLFEIVYAADRKVVKYQDEGLVLLGAVNTDTGEEYNPESVHVGFRWVKGIRPAIKIDPNSFRDFDDLQKQDLSNEEGYVAVWYNSNGPAFRVKIKFETYKRLHRLYFQTTTDVIWELLRDDKDLGEFLEGSDAALTSWAYSQAASMKEMASIYDSAAKADFKAALGYMQETCGPEAEEKDKRKAFAFIAAQKKPFSSLLFLLYDGSFDGYEKALWKLVKPENKRFSSVEDEG